MNKFKYFFILLTALGAFVSCNKDDDNNIEVEPLRDFATQFAADKATIESYLNTHYIVVTENEGNVDDMDVIIDSIETPATQVPIMSYKANVGTAVFPQLKSKNVDLHGITYEFYYLVLREGTGESPINTDGVLTSYSGEYLSNVEKNDKHAAYISSTFFEQIRYPQSAMDLGGLISGWGETFPEFNAGTVTGNQDGTISYKNFGAGVMFLPSGLGYYSGSGAIPSYRPLVFSFKLYQIQRLDHDADGVLDVYEDKNGDGYVRDLRNITLYPNAPVNPDDTDNDGIPDFLDIDDDGDGYTTKLEITKPSAEVGGAFGPGKYYPFEAFVVEDDPSTPNINESLNSEPKGIPAFVKTKTITIKDPADPTGVKTKEVIVNEYDYTTPGRLKIHLDKLHNTTKVTTP